MTVQDDSERIMAKRRAKKRVICNMFVDPGLGGTGIAIWTREAFARQLAVPDYVLTLHSKPNIRGAERYGERAADIAAQARDVADTHNVHSVWIEEPAYFQSHRGQTAARSGSLVKLSITTGALLYSLTRRRPPTLITANAWKGTLNDSQVKERVEHVLGSGFNQDWSQHAVDAVGIGLEVMGLWP